MKLNFCTLFSGSSGNCIYLGEENSHILIDVGVSATMAANALKEIGVDPFLIDGILITHEHSDHISGVGAFSRRFNVPVFANLKTWQAMEKKAGDIPVKNTRVFQNGQDFYVKNIDVHSFSTPHDAADSVGYALYCGGKKVSIATDLGHFPTRILDNIKDSDLVLIESNHDRTMLMNGKYPAYLKRRILSNRGHLSNDTCAEACLKLVDHNVRRFILGHLSKENNSEQLAISTVCGVMGENHILPGKDIYLGVGPRNTSSPLYPL